MKLCLIYFACAVLAFGSCVPDYFPSCKRSDPEITKCVLAGIETVKSKLKDGIPEINLPPLDPFRMDKLDINTSLTGAKMKATITNIVASGGSEFNINYLKIDLDNKYAADLELEFPQLQVSAEYSSRGSRMLLFTVNGRGTYSGNFTKVSVVAKCVASPMTKNNKEYLQIDSITTKISFGHAELNVKPAEWSFAGSAATSFIGSSPSVVLNLFAPVIDETAAAIVKQYINEVLSTVPINEVLLD